MEIKEDSEVCGEYMEDPGSGDEKLLLWKEQKKGRLLSNDISENRKVLFIDVI